MTDCPNAEIRDRLPDLLHDRLDAATRAAVMAHVDGCEDCREELELLRGVRKAIVAGTPRLNLSDIVYALPKPHAADAPVRRRVPRVDWRLAAAVTLLVAGASSLTLLSRGDSRRLNPVDSSVVAVAPTTAPIALPSAGAESTTSAPVTNATSKVVVPAPSQAVASADVPDNVAIDEGPAAARLSGLNTSQLKALLSDIDQMQAVPVSDPEPVSIKIDAKTNPSGPEGM
jgi:hypothetical protein